MTPNIGGVERLLRFAFGFLLFSLLFTAPVTPLGWLGVVPMLFGALGFCPVYHVLARVRRRDDDRRA